MPHQGSHGQTTKADNRVPVANICPAMQRKIDAEEQLNTLIREWMAENSDGRDSRWTRPHRLPHRRAVRERGQRHRPGPVVTGKMGSDGGHESQRSGQGPLKKSNGATRATRKDKRHAALLLPLFMGKKLLAMATLMAASMSQLLLGLH